VKVSNIKSVCIVGGGSAGWMTAALLSKKLDFLDITLIESPNVPTVGVGESTLGHINKFLDMLELKDEDWMKECNATYKSSIKFTDFRKKGTYFHYPFGNLALDLMPNNGIMDYFWYSAYNGHKNPVTDFAEFVLPQTVMTDANKMTYNEDGTIPMFDHHLDTAYHMDAELFGQYLKNKIALPNRVTHIQDHIKEITRTPVGDVGVLRTEGGLELSADLYIDCTGFKKLLIEETLGVEFLSFHDILMNDRAWAARVPYVDRENEMDSFTNCTAIENGWVWNIPLWNRIGTGYVYSSKFVSDDDAKTEFKNHLAKRLGDRVEELEFRNIKIRHGIQKEPWKNNVCAIGLALGFIEPLESTGLLTTHENIIRLVATLQKRNGFVNQLDKDGWNFAAREEIEGFKQFVSIHYGLSEREDTNYWKHVTNNVSYVKNHLDLVPEFRYNNLGMIYSLNSIQRLDDNQDGKPFIIAGMGLNPLSQNVAEMEANRFPGMPSIWQNAYDRNVARREKIKEYVKTLPTHYEFLRDNIYGGKNR
jgi:flavin-dependent dehydrogenase